MLLFWGVTFCADFGYRDIEGRAAVLDVQSCLDFGYTDMKGDDMPHSSPGLPRTSVLE